MSYYYFENANALDRANDEAEVWAVVVTPERAREDMRNHLFGAMMNNIDPETFAGMLDRAARFAGQPDDYAEHGPVIA